MKKLILILFIFIVNISFSQTIKGVVLDESENAIFNVTIFNTSSQEGVVSGSRGDFSIEGKQGDIIIFRYLGKQEITYEIPKTDALVLYKVFRMEKSKIKLKEFVVSGTRIKDVSVNVNENILDYIDLGIEMFLVLKKRSSNYYISIEGVGIVYREIKLENWRPQSLFKDCIGNVHLICKDSVRQLYLGEKMKSISTISHREFNAFLKTSIYLDDTTLISYSFTNHNKKYRVFSTKNKKLKVIYETMDKVGEKVAASYFVSNSGYTRESSNVGYGRALFEKMSWYKHVVGKEIYVKTFINSELLFTFNFFEKNIQIDNLKGDSIHKTKFNFQIKGERGKVILDKYANIFYNYSISNGVASLEKIDVNSGAIISKFILNEFTFPKKVKVIDNWVYFVKINKNGFHKLYRIKI